MRTIRLFFSYVIIEVNLMKKVVIDAGHGGSDPGASGNGIIEKEYTLKIYS